MVKQVLKTQSDEFYEKLSALVLPIMIQSFMLALVSAADAIMLGFVDQTSLSSVSLAGQVQFVLNLFAAGISGGMAILLAQYWGKEDSVTVGRIIPIALRVNLLTGTVFTLVTMLFPIQVMRIFTDEADLILKGGDYLKAVSLSYLLCSVSQIYLTVLKNTGKASVSSRISSCVVVLNIIVNALLIFGWLGFHRLGIVGAAYATVLARAVELAWCIWETRKPGYIRIPFDKLFTREKELSADFWRYTIPVLVAALVWGIAFVLYSVIMGHMGSDAVAANSITGIAKSLVSCLIRGLGAGAGIMIGNTLGADRLDTAKIYGQRLTRLSIAIGVVTGALLIAFSPLIVRFAPITPAAAGYLQQMLIFCGVNLAFQSVNITVLDGIFCAGGDSNFDWIGNIFAMWCFSVPLGFIGAFWLHLPVWCVFCIVNMDEIIKIPLVYRRYKKYIWLRNITR